MPWSIGWCSKVNTRGPSGLEVIRLLSNETAKTNDDEELSADVKFTVKLIQEDNRCPRKRFRDKYNGGCYATSNKAVRNSQSLAIIKYPTKPPKPKLLWTSAFRRKVFASICAVDFVLNIGKWSSPSGNTRTRNTNYWLIWECSRHMKHRMMFDQSVTLRFCIGLLLRGW